MLARLAELFEIQAELISCHSKSYKNEYETMKSLQSLPAQDQQNLRRTALEFLEKLEKPADTEAIAKSSRFFREEGNRIYKCAGGDEDKGERMLRASCLYTKAIEAAENVYEELCLAYANRGMALQEFGYYSQAYDDCVLALEFGYPEKQQHKLIMRQACCAWKLRNAELLAQHLQSLGELQLNESFQRQLEELRVALQLLKDAPEEPPAKSPAAKQSVHEIVNAASSRGRHMIAKQRIENGSFIFEERAECFVPLPDSFICQQCAATLLIPIPCPDCQGYVVYCSLKCRQRHAHIHAHECAGYRCQLLGALGVSHLALRLVLTYLPQLLPRLRDKATGEELWQTLMTWAKPKTDDVEAAPQALQSLRMITHLDKLPEAALMYQTLCVHMLQIYLQRCTKFYDQFEGTAASRQDWQLIVSALMLRNIGQLLVNGHVGDDIVPPGEVFFDSSLLLPGIWQRPNHLKLGCLHRLCGGYRLITVINLPKLSLLNHSCAPSIRTKYDGCSVSNYASQQIEAGEEIFNCYYGEYKMMMKQPRQQQLAETFHFRCKCSKCERQQPDQDYFKFHRYRCQNVNCRREFVPVAPPNKNHLIWWSEVDGFQLRCSLCQSLQDTRIYDEFIKLFNSSNSSKIRRQQYKYFEKTKQWLLDNHFLKLIMAEHLINSWFRLLEVGCLFVEKDYEQLTKITQFALAILSIKAEPNSTEYMSRLSYLWDLIAWGKCQCSAEEMQTMVASLKYLAEEHKTIFLNYYNDFIEQRCKGNKFN